MTIFEFLKNPIGALRAFSFDGFRILFDSAFGQSEPRADPPGQESEESPVGLLDRFNFTDSDAEEFYGEIEGLLPVVIKLWQEFQWGSDFWQEVETYLQNSWLSASELAEIDSMLLEALQQVLLDIEDSPEYFPALLGVEFVHPQTPGDGIAFITASFPSGLELTLAGYANAVAAAKVSFILDTVPLGLGEVENAASAAFAPTAVHPLEQGAGLDPLDLPILSDDNLHIPGGNAAVPKGFPASARSENPGPPTGIGGSQNASNPASAGQNLISGTSGDDVLLSQLGDDILFGDGGADQFVFQMTGVNGDMAPGEDTILDFSAGDILAFSGLLDQGGAAGVDLSDLDAISSFQKAGADLEITFTGGGQLTLSFHGNSGFTSFTDIDNHVDYTVIVSA